MPSDGVTMSTIRVGVVACLAAAALALPVTGHDGAVEWSYAVIHSGSGLVGCAAGTPYGVLSPCDDSGIESNANQHHVFHGMPDRATGAVIELFWQPSQELLAQELQVTFPKPVDPATIELEGARLVAPQRVVGEPSLRVVIDSSHTESLFVQGNDLEFSVAVPPTDRNALLHDPLGQGVGHTAVYQHYDLVVTVFYNADDWPKDFTAQ